jgi:3-hydroxyacyl-CoA dehydrogenase
MSLPICITESRRRRPYKESVAGGDLGAKTGRGFYDWSVKSADEARARRDGFVLQMLGWQRDRKE